MKWGKRKSLLISCFRARFEAGTVQMRGWLDSYASITFVSDTCRNYNKGMLMLQKTRYNTEEELPPPPSPPQLKEVSSLDGVPRPTSTERILAETAAQHVILRDGHQQVAAALLSLCISCLLQCGVPRYMIVAWSESSLLQSLCFLFFSSCFEDCGLTLYSLFLFWNEVTPTALYVHYTCRPIQTH
jgi:hypothetical protein